MYTIRITDVITDVFISFHLENDLLDSSCSESGYDMGQNEIRQDN